MTTLTLASLSDELATRTAASAACVVQVAGSRRPASGVVHGADTVITTARAIGREDGLQVRRPDDVGIDADLVGWDPATGIAVLRTRQPLGLEVASPSAADARTGAIVLAIARSWSNAVTASTGAIAVVGGPLRTGRRRQIERVIRITAPMHEGFAGGGVFDVTGRLIGIATAAEIRRFGVVIPASIAWAAAERVLQSGTPRRGFIGVAVQSVELQGAQRLEGRERALIVLAVTADSPAAAAGLLVGDLLLDVDGKQTSSSEDLLDVLAERGVGQAVTVRLLRGGTPHEVQITIAERPSR